MTLFLKKTHSDDAAAVSVDFDGVSLSHRRVAVQRTSQCGDDIVKCMLLVIVQDRGVCAVRG